MYFMAVTYTNHWKSAVEGLSCVFLASVLNMEWDTQLSLIDGLVFTAEVIHGNILSKEYSACDMAVIKGSWDPLKDVELIKFARSTTFCAKYLIMALGSLVPEEFESSHYDPLRERISQDIPKIEYLRKLVHGLVLCKKSWLHYKSVSSRLLGIST